MKPRRVAVSKDRREDRYSVSFGLAWFYGRAYLCLWKVLPADRVTSFGRKDVREGEWDEEHHE